MSSSWRQASAAPPDVAGGERDLDARWEQRNAVEPTRGLVERTVDRRFRCRHVALRQAEQREARLRLVAAAARGAVGGLGRVESALDAMEVAFDRERPAAGALLRAALLEPLARTPCLLERVGPGAL